MSRKEIKVAIVDDSPFDRTLLRHYVKKHKNCKLIFESVNGFDLLNKLNEHYAEIIILDMYMPMMDGIETLINLQARKYIGKILCISSSYEPKKIILLKKLGATGYCPKLKHHFEKAFEFILNGKSYFDETIYLKIADEFLHATIQFSGKEIEIIQYLSQGLNYEEIAQKIPHLCAKTIELYVQSLVLKYDFKNKIQMITYCCTIGIINTFDDSEKTSNLKPQTSNLKPQTSNIKH